MQNLTSSGNLKNAIQLLKAKQEMQEQQIKELFLLAYDRFKPVNILKSNIAEIVSSSQMVRSVLYAGLGLAFSYIAKRAAVGTSVGRVRTVLGSLIQMGISAYSTKKVLSFQSHGKALLNMIFRNKKSNSHHRE
jgi:hypothetical protein